MCRNAEYSKSRESQRSCREIVTTFDKADMQAVFLSALTLTYPILAEKGLRFSEPIAVVLANEEQESIIQMNSAQSLEILPVSESPGTLERYLQKAEYNLLLFRYDAGRYTKENLKRISAFMKRTGTNIAEQRLAMILYIGLPANPQFHSGILYMNLCKSAKSLDLLTGKFSRKKFVQFLIENEDLLMEEIQSKLCAKTEHNDKVLEAVFCILENFWKRKYSSRDQEAILPCFQRVKENIELLWSPVNGADTYAEAFVQAAYALQSNDTPQCFSRNDVPKEQEQYLEKVMLYDDQAYYIPVMYLDKICGLIVGKEGASFVKGQLCEAGLLEREGRGRTYYTKMTEILIGNRVVRRRYAKIRREKMDLAGKETWLEVMQMKGEKIDDADNRAWNRREP